MDAKPNDLNQLIEVPNLIHNHLLLQSCGFCEENHIYFLRFDPASEEYAAFVAIAPLDLVSGSDVTVKLLWGPWATNETGVVKGVVWRIETNHIKYPNTLEAGTVHDKVIGIVDLDEPALTIHLDTLGVISSVLPGEHLGVELRRRAADAADTWANDVIAGGVMILEYVSTLLKKV